MWRYHGAFVCLRESYGLRLHSSCFCHGLGLIMRGTRDTVFGRNLVQEKQMKELGGEVLKKARLGTVGGKPLLWLDAGSSGHTCV